MIRRIIIFLFIFYACIPVVPAQEVVTGLQINTRVVNAVKDMKMNKRSSADPTLSLPFFEDFSGKSLLPDSKKWSDNYVFINNTYSDQQITQGIATFDAIGNTGRLYETASTLPFSADKLTSQPLDLNYSSAENIWMSFFYQAGGLADPPEKNDSLTLQFFAPDENMWYSVWKTSGTTDLKFKPAIIKIANSRFLRKGFQFRFTNYASLSPNTSDPSLVANCDIWNIDYILIDRNRNGADTVFSDVAYRLPVRSLLKSHEAMPWKQFRNVELQEMGSSINVNYRNNDTIARNVTRDFEISDVYNNSVSHSFTAGATIIGPLTNVPYKANLIYTFNTTNSDSALFKITCSLKTDEFDPKANDTLTYYQTFRNYFAFDDGSAEGGYGINGLGSRNAMFAYRFKSFIQDTLRAITICFNDSYQNANKRAFDLMVWKDNNGMPGDVLCTAEEVMVEQGSQINGFYNYNLPEGIPVDDIFYVGWKQRSETFLNAGFDINTPNNGRQFYWLNGDWRASQTNGSVMIRPILGDRIRTVSINETEFSGKNSIKIWPNPANDYLRVSLGDEQNREVTRISVIDLCGRKLIDVPFSDLIDISNLKEGIYIVVALINGRQESLTRLIKMR
jgi:hypothetical protein